MSTYFPIRNFFMGHQATGDKVFFSSTKIGEKIFSASSPSPKKKDSMTLALRNHIAAEEPLSNFSNFFYILT